MLQAVDKGWALVIVPKKGLLTDLSSQSRPILSSLGIESTIANEGSPFPAPSRKLVYFVTPHVALQMMNKQPLPEASLRCLQLVVCENLELLDQEYEVAVSLLLHATQFHSTRFVGLSASSADPSGLASWLRVPSLTLTSFQPKDREQDLSTSIQTFTIPYSIALFKAMARPTHAAVSSAGGEASIVFVPSRNRCKMVANDLITQCAMDLKMQGYLPSEMSPIDIEPYTARLQEKSLADLVMHGIGIYHDGLTRPDRALMLELYAEGITRVLVASRDALFSLPLRASVVVAMGTQYVKREYEDERRNDRDASLANQQQQHDRQIGNYELAEIVHMQGRAVQYGRDGSFLLLCQAEGHAILTRFLDEGLPLESSLHESPLLSNWLQGRWEDGSMDRDDKQATMDLLSWTYLSRRMESNPMYYDAIPDEPATSLSRLVDQLHAIKP